MAAAVAVERLKTVASLPAEDAQLTQTTTPSIVADVLSKKGLNAVDTINKSMKELSQKADVLKSQVYGSIYKKYTEFYHALDFEDVNKKLVKLVREMNKLGDDIQNVTLTKLDTAETDLVELTKEYDKNQEVIKALKKLIKMHESIKSCKSGLHYKDYLLAARSVKDMRGYLNELTSATCELKIFKAVRDEYRVQKAFLVSKLDSSWSRLLEWNTVTSVSWDVIDGHLKTSLNVHSPDASSADLKSSTYGITSLASLYDAMEYAEIFDARLKIFAKKMMNYLLKPLVIFPGLKPDFQNEKIWLVKDDMKVKGRRPGHATVYKKISSVIRFVSCHVFASPPREEVKENGGPCDAPRSGPLMKLESLIWPELSELIIKECLSSAVPTNNSQLKKYDSVVSLTNDFEKELSMLGFLDANANTLSSYAKDINVHFANKRCQDLLVEARDLMTSEIHSMIKLQVNKDRARLITEIDSDKQFTKETRMMLSGLKDIPQSSLGTEVFHFPECRISETTQKLMDLAYNTLLEAATSTPQVAIQLFYSVRNIFELYSDVVPTYHRESLELPQLAALHYNNCLYLAHHCTTLGHQFKASLPAPLNQGVTTFIDLVPVLRKSGEKCFLEQLRKQKIQLLEVLQVCNGFSDFDNEETIFAAQKSFEQILNLLVRLSKVWRTVLPEHIYNKSLGSLFSTVLDDIVSQIVQLEDISAEEATQFHRLLKILLNRAGEIFNLTPKDEIKAEDMGFIVHISSWQKFSETINIMESSLQGIVDRWADGKGPLAQSFDASNVKCLIKALFQNTNRREQALAKIKTSKK